jgi:hypothetical protein
MLFSSLEALLDSSVSSSVVCPCLTCPDVTLLICCRELSAHWKLDGALSRGLLIFRRRRALSRRRALVKRWCPSMLLPCASWMLATKPVWTLPALPQIWNLPRTVGRMDESRRAPLGWPP